MKSLKKETLFKVTATSLLTLLAFAGADTISLKNGDKITGKILLIEDNTIHIKTDYAGTLNINSNDIASFKLKAPVAVKENRFTRSFTSTEVVYNPEKKGDEDRIIVKSHGIPQSIPFNKDLLIAKVNSTTLKPKEFKHSGNINVSAYFDNDSSKTTRYRIKGNYKLEYGLWRHHFGTQLYRKTDNDRTKDYYYNLNYSVDRFITPRFFWQASSNFEHDWIEDIRDNFLMGTGPGIQVWNDARSSLSFATLLNYQKIEYRDHDTTNNPQLSLKWDYQQYFYNQKIRFSTKGTVGRSFNENVKLDLTLNATLAYRLTDSLSFNTGYHYEKIKAKRGDSSNRGLSIGIGYEW